MPYCTACIYNNERKAHFAGFRTQLTTTFQEDRSRPNTSRSGLQEGQVTGEGVGTGVGVAVMIVDDFRLT